MVRPIVATKLYVPKPRRALVDRPRLGARLRSGAGSRLTLVSAPAGFGKTTLLAEFLGGTQDADRAVAWLSLDPADNEPAAFWTYVVTALRTALPAVGRAALELLASGPVPAEPMLTTVVNELAAVPAEVWLVLDDYHLVDDHEIRDAMVFLLEHLPPHVHVVLSTRADPDLPLARWRVRGELVEIRAADLRFTADEAAAYLNEVARLDLAARDIEMLEERTEGWIAALQLAALSIRGRADAGGFIARFAGTDRYVVDYLADEVLRHQPGPVREFLADSAVLDRLTGPLCDAVTGRDDGGRMLVTLERANLFVVALDDRREWYRYHHLFADVLRARLLSEQPERVPLLHRRASRWYQEHDLAPEAVGHALAAADVDLAVHLMELAVPEVRRDRRDAMMFGWLRALPDDAVRRSAVLSVFRGHMLMTAGDLAAVEPRLADAERALAAVPDGSRPSGADTAELRTLPATIAVYRAALAQALGDAAGTSHHARRALELAGPDDHLARGAAAGFLGLAAWATGDMATALPTFTQAVASLHAAGNLTDERGGIAVLADMWLAAGHPGTARRLLDRALRLAREHGAAVPRATADLHVGLSELDHHAGDLDGARRHLEAATALGEQSFTTEGRHRWFVAAALIAGTEGDPERAIELLDRAERLYRRGFFPEVRPIAALKARVHIARGDPGDLAQAADWAREHGVSATDDVSYLREFDHLTLARLLIAQHRADEALPLLGRLHDAAEAAGRAGSLAEIRALRALAQPGTDIPPAADPLSGRELQVLRLLAGELSGPQIARELFVTLNTLRAHTKHIFTKLDVTSRRAAVRRGHERGLL